MSSDALAPKFEVHHVALSVKDLGACIGFYENFGFSVLGRWQNDNGEFTVAHMVLASQVLELFCFSESQEPPGSMNSLWTDLRQIGTKHLGLRVRSLQRAREWVIELGLAPADVPIIEGMTGISYFFVNDPSGNWVEILEDNRALLGS